MKKATQDSSNSYSLRYVSFKDEEELSPSRFSGSSDFEEPSEAEAAASSTMKMTEDGPVYSGGGQMQSSKMTDVSHASFQPKRIRLRAVESESDYFLKLMNVDLIRKLVIIQVISFALIIMCQLLFYATLPIEFRGILDHIGIGLWGPVLIFAPTCWLTYVTTKSPSGCSIGTSMACQIITILVSLALLIFATIDLTERAYTSHWSKWEDGEESYSPVPAKVFCSFIILASIGMVFTSIIASIQYCKVTCCGRSTIHETLRFDVETARDYD